MKYIEDIFSEWYRLYIKTNKLCLHNTVDSAVHDFNSLIERDLPLTEKQGNYLLFILKRYSEYDTTNSQWKMNFRVINLEKLIYVKDGLIYLKCPWSVSSEFVSLFPNLARKYDPDIRCRIFSPYHINIFKLLEFVQTHGFDICNTFYKLVGYVETVYNDANDIIPYSTVIDNTVYIVNACIDAQDYFDSRKNGIIEHDLLLAKRMNFLYSLKPRNVIEKISANTTNTFWITDVRDFLKVCSYVDGKVCVVLDHSEITTWISDLIYHINDSSIISINDVGIPGNKYFNTFDFSKNWKDKKIIVTQKVPDKWIFKENIEVSVVATNWIYPCTLNYVKNWMDSLPIVLYCGDIRPTSKREIIQL